MKGYLLLLWGSLYTVTSRAQSEQQVIQQWQSLHPNIQFVSEQRYASFSEEERALLGKEIILYKDKITLALLEGYDLAEKSASLSQLTYKEDDKSILKNWLAVNSDVKIVPRSVYDSADDVRKAIYDDNPRCLVLEGETLTVKDIERFEQ